MRAKEEAPLSALEAAQRTLQHRAASPLVRSKGGRDLVTETDVAVEDAVRAELARFGAWPVVGVERGGAPPVDGSPYWLLDPICGTRVFACGLPLYCCNLALVEGGRVVLAGVGESESGPNRVAELGAGARVRTS